MIVAFDFAELDLDLGYDMNTFLGNPVLECAAKHPDVPIFVMPQYEQKRNLDWRMKPGRRACRFFLRRKSAIS